MITKDYITQLVSVSMIELYHIYCIAVAMNFDYLKQSGKDDGFKKLFLTAIINDKYK